MRVSDVAHILEAWAPRGAAWSDDNVGLQVGWVDAPVRKILVALDPTLEVAHEAASTNAGLIVTHHPLLFHPLRSLTSGSEPEATALFLAEHKISLYSAHTNLDSARGGVSFALAQKLTLRSQRLLAPLKDSLVKIVVFAPRSSVDVIADAMHRAGGGRFSRYVECSFRGEGVGTFRGTNEARPFIGTPGVLARVPETRLEMICSTWDAENVISAMLRAHPYEEVAYDVIPVKNAHPDFGFGVVGTLPEPMRAKAFLDFVRKSLGAERVRWTGTTRKLIRHVAVCGGAGGELAHEALRQGADAFVTSDLKYHGFHALPPSLLVVDAGHYETEAVIVPVIVNRLRREFRNRSAVPTVVLSRISTNPIRYH